MDPTVLKISMAAFFHDIGKFAGKKELGLSNKDIDPYDEQLYLKSYNGKYSHYHALYTAYFIKKYANYLPVQLTDVKWGEGDIFVNLAAMHHKPESLMQQIITIADRLSSGIDRDEFNKNSDTVNFKDYKKTRLLPILEQLNPVNNQPSDSISDYKYRYPLKPVNAKNIFPCVKKDLALTNKQADDEYKELFNKFTDGLKQLAHIDNLQLWYEHFNSLMMIYTSHIPAARVGNVIPDVSLYDHCCTTSAIATAFYLYHTQTDTFSKEKIKSEKENKFLLINGDFRGIQNFIFSSSVDSQKFRSKILRGRSFAVSLLSELASDMLCRELGLPSASVILNAAGKFTIIAQNTNQAQSAVQKIKKEINDWLVKISFGETNFNIAVQKASVKDFLKGNFSDLWDRFNITMEQEKYSGFDENSYCGVVDRYLDGFINTPEKRTVCPLCKKRPAIDTVQEESVCKICRDHIFLGSNIVKKKKLIICFKKDSFKEDCLHEPLFGKYQLFFLDNLKETDKEVVKYWNFDTDNIENSDATLKFIKGYVPVYSKEDVYDDRIISSKKSDKTKLENIDQIKPGEIKTLNHIACMAKKFNPEKAGKYQGIESLGVLKADIDNLGLLMACGLKKERFTLSRIATLSRQINYYFTVYLPWFLENNKFNDTYTVFAGGDDLFLIGPWNNIIELATIIQQTFADYVCQNKNITISAGISLHKPHTTVDTMAEFSENSLEMAKNAGRNRLTLFSETVEWPRIDKLLQIESIFIKWLDKNWISRVMFYRFNEFIKMAEKEKQIMLKEEIHIDDMACTKWRSLLAYSINRNIKAKQNEKEEAKQEIMVNLAKWLDEYKAELKIPLWKILYNRRQEG